MDQPSEPAPVASCPEHPDEAVVGTCARCGRFLCSLCRARGSHDEELCRSCARLARSGEAGDAVRRAFQGLALAMGIRVAFLWALAWLAGSARAQLGTSLIAASIVASAPFLAVAVLLWLGRRPILAWLALGLDTLAFGGIAAYELATGKVSLLALVLLMLPASTLARVLRLHRLVLRNAAGA